MQRWREEHERVQVVSVAELVNEGGRCQPAVARPNEDRVWVLVHEMAELLDPNRQRLTATVGGVHRQPGRPIGLDLFSLGRTLKAVGDDQATHLDICKDTSKRDQNPVAPDMAEGRLVRLLPRTQVGGGYAYRLCGRRHWLRVVRH